MRVGVKEAFSRLQYQIEWKTKIMFYTNKKEKPFVFFVCYGMAVQKLSHILLQGILCKNLEEFEKNI